KKVIEASGITEYIEYAQVKLTLDYKQMQNFEYQLKKLDGVIVKQVFSENINLLVKLPEKHLTVLTEQFKLDQ
ncbi:MAG: DUF1949 domain-containing protein, partial [Methylococcales bacterium]|nr:DUF1949 domain-containing protein [Methylococcales bacterium]